MTSLSHVRRAVVLSIACVGVVLTGPRAAAQTAALHAAFSVALMPQFQRLVWPGDFNRDGRTDLVGSFGLGMGRVKRGLDGRTASVYGVDIARVVEAPGVDHARRGRRPMPAWLATAPT